MLAQPHPLTRFHSSQVLKDGQSETYESGGETIATVTHLSRPTEEFIFFLLKDLKGEDHLLRDFGGRE